MRGVTGFCNSERVSNVGVRFDGPSQNLTTKGKGKAVPLQAWIGPEGS